MKKNISFEEALSALEEIVRRLESSDTTLEDSLKSFEEAVKLVKICNEKLDNARSRVSMLVEGEDGSVSDLPFDLNDET